METLELGSRPLVIADVVRAARGPLRVTVSTATRRRMIAARKLLDRHLHDGVPVYGLNTGLGANIGHRMTANEAGLLQEALVLPRVAGVGSALPIETCRATLFCRLAGLAQSAAGISLPVFDLLADMLAADIVPVLPRHGSNGASDLVQTMAIAAAALGHGEVWHGSERMPASDALKRAGLPTARLAPKDGLSIGSATSLTVATAALAIAEFDELLARHVEVSALSCQGFGANPHLFDAATAAIRPAAGQVDAAERFRAALAGGDFAERASAKVQDAISFRGLPQVTGMLIAARDACEREVLVDLNHAADNPVALSEGGTVFSTANFLAPALALSLDALAIAMTQFANASVQRSIKLMTGRLSGLPNFLSPVGGASAGFVPMQKSLAALLAEVRLRATPASIDSLVVSDMVEDFSTNTLLCATKLCEQMESVRWIVTVEALVAAQSVDVRREIDSDLKLGDGSERAYRRVRSVVPQLDADRATGPDAALVHAVLWNTALS